MVGFCENGDGHFRLFKSKEFFDELYLLTIQERFCSLELVELILQKC